MKRKEVILEGLSCANCATKIEDSVKKLDGIEDVSVNFVSKTLKFKIDNESKIEEIEKIVKKIEPDVKVLDKEKLKEVDDEENERKSSIRRLVFSLIIFVTAILIREPFFLKISLFTVSYLSSGWKVLFKAFKNIRNGTVFDENFLMSVATIGAFAIGEFPEAVGVMIFYEIGELFQDMAVDNSRKSIKSLLNMRPDYANLLVEDKISKVSPEDVQVGQLILIKPGEKVPLDGVAVKGNSAVDTSALTGEPIPRSIEVNDEILSGSINLSGVITVKVLKEYKESTFSKILEIVENASSKKANTEKFITKFARYYTPIIVFSAITLAIVPPLLTGDPFINWLYRGLIFLVISCPCALVISIPLSYFAGIGRLSKEGVLVKGGNYLETLKNMETLVFDKTGTLTEGVFEVSEIKSYNGIKEDKLLELAAHAENYSNHPIAKSIKEYYNRDIGKDIIDEYEEVAGKGVKARIKENIILIGNKDLLEENGIKTPFLDTDGTIAYIAYNNNFAGYIKISDKIRKTSKDTIKKLKEIGIKNTVLLTGDNKKTAQKVAKYLGIDEYYAKLLPEDKVKILEQYLKEKPSVGFVGDGINDAPVLARADVGIAMGGLGSDAAIEAADVVIMEDDLLKLVEAKNVSLKTSKIIWQNLAIILTIKVLFLTLAAFGLTNMWGAVFADVGVTLLSIFNSLRIFR
ncbi:ATPase [Petrotoga sp. 9PW.55.5.1]|uniref:heavy metal translocating P-type ATPase n=1 Tax=Petrotoga sp. 9PW.55.5.1 TaxID=1308979 RepID=UPI000DC47EAE|nr:heavy metal translocating P-type ATPase [Petrotoga sp. 9PW.55.5.1]RAO99023.1 ATPase [Petrotoga sp. 9PW.55.5.1]